MQCEWIHYSNDLNNLFHQKYSFSDAACCNNRATTSICGVDTFQWNDVNSWIMQCEWIHIQMIWIIYFIKSIHFQMLAAVTIESHLFIHGWVIFCKSLWFMNVCMSVHELCSVSGIHIQMISGQILIFQYARPTIVHHCAIWITVFCFNFLISFKID